MANKTPHIVGGGLGTFRKASAEKAEAERKAAQKTAQKATFARIANAK